MRAADLPENAIALSPREAARALSVSERTLATWTAAGSIPSIRIGRRRLYPVAQLREWLARQVESGVSDGL